MTRSGGAWAPSRGRGGGRKASARCLHLKVCWALGSGFFGAWPVRPPPPGRRWPVPPSAVRPSGRRAPGSSAPGPHLCPAFTSPRQAFELDPLEPAASFPTADISPAHPSPPPLQPLRVLSTRATRPSAPRRLTLSRSGLGSLWVAAASSPPPSVSPSPPQSASHCLPPSSPSTPPSPPALGGLLPHLLCHV